MARLYKGFTLVEIMIVVGIILLLAGIAIPNLLRARLSGREAAASGALRTISAAEISYRATHSSYANLSQLYEDSPPYIDSVLATGNRQGYIFVVNGVNSRQFFATAEPQFLYQGHSYYTDEDGLLCRSNNVNVSAPTTHISSGCPSNFTEIE
ncbi:MAG: prepilin-type N-terminal cleavage/methylation domain-containing protein [Candidatus Omnitrophica bacterium]|nr:prepilin-type N-terminal cleavage/methylation domain-containing protein [Candidatus Omnitrophota bacterium]